MTETNNPPGAPSGAARPNDPVNPVLAVIAVVAAIMIYYLIAGLAPKFDALGLFWPYFSLLSDYARSGQLLLWNPYVNCGSPDMAYVEMGSFSPVTLLLALLTGGSYAGFMLYWAAIWATFGVGTARLGLRLGADRTAAAAVTVGLTLGGFFLGHATHTSWLYVFCFLPLILERLEALMAGGGRWPAVEAGALYGLSALAGHPALVILNAIYLGLWVAGRVAFPAAGAVDAGPRRAVNAVLGLALLLVVGVAVLSPAYFAFFREAAGYSDRAGYLSRSFAVNNEALRPGALATLSSPWLTTVDMARNIWRGTNPLLTCCYLGAAVPALAVAGLLSRRRGFEVWLAVVGVFFLAAAVGDALPVRGWLYDWCPPTRYFRHSAVMRGYFMFSVGMLAMMATAELRSDGAGVARFWRSAVAAGAVLCPALVAAFAAVVSRTDYRAGMTAAIAQMVVAWGGFFAVAGLGWRRPEQGRLAVRFLLALVLVDGAFSIGIGRDFMVISRSESEWFEHGRVRSIDLMSTGLHRSLLRDNDKDYDFHFYFKEPALEGFNQLANRFHSPDSLQRLPANWCGERPLYSAVVGQKSRIWFSPTAAPVFPSDATFAAFVERARQLGAFPFVIHRPEAMVSTPPRDVPGPDDDAESDLISRLPPARRIPYRLLDYTTTHLALAVDCDQPGWLLVTDRWSRSWTVKVNGRRVDPWAGNFLFRAAPVGPGAQTVEFEFQPALHPALLYLSWGLLLMVVAGSIRRGRRPTGR